LNPKGAPARPKEEKKGAPIRCVENVHIREREAAPIKKRVSQGGATEED